MLLALVDLEPSQIGQCVLDSVVAVVPEASAVVLRAASKVEWVAGMGWGCGNGNGNGNGTRPLGAEIGIGKGTEG